MGKYDSIRDQAFRANMIVHDAGLAILTWGNASQVDRRAGVMAIKPSGVSYDGLKPEHMVIVSLKDGTVVDGKLKPSSDTPTHLVLYRTFANIGGIVHTHSHFATCWAQVPAPIPCLGTTHADSFHGEIPVTRLMHGDEIASAYEANTGKVIAEHFSKHSRNPDHTPGVLVAHHGPFAWGRDALAAAESAMILEEVARMAYHTRMMAGRVNPAPENLVEKHFERKHGKHAYYGQ